MREFAGATSRPPQIVNGDTYCGDFEAFAEAVEMERLREFLHLDYKEEYQIAILW